MDYTLLWLAFGCVSYTGHITSGVIMDREQMSETSGTAYVYTGHFIEIEDTVPP